MSDLRSKRAEAEAWWAFAARVIAFFLGVFLLLREQQATGAADFYLVMAGIGCIGPVVAQSVALMLSSVRGGGGGE